MTERSHGWSFFVPVPARVAITVCGDHTPAVRHLDDGIWRKVKVVPAVFKPSEPPPDQSMGGSGS